MARFVLDARDERGVTVLLIEHHMDIITGICDRMLVLSYGEVIDTGIPREVVEEPARHRGLPGRRAWRRPDSTMRRRRLGLFEPTTTLPRLLAANARALPRARWRMREKDRGIWQQTQLVAVARIDAGLRRRARSAGLRARRRAAGAWATTGRTCTPGMLAAGALARLCDAGLSGRRARRGAPCDPGLGSALRAGRGPGAGRQDPRPARELPDRSSTSIYDDPRGLAAYHAPGPAVVGRRCSNCGAERLAARAGAAPGADRTRARPTTRRSSSTRSGTTGRPKGVVLSHRNVLSGVANAHRAQGLRLRRGGAGLPADGLGRRLRVHRRRRHRAALHHQRARAAGDGAARPARDRAHVLPGRAAQLGQPADDGAGAHGGLHAPEEGAVRLLHAAGGGARARAARRPRAQRRAEADCARSANGWSTVRSRTSWA